MVVEKIVATTGRWINGKWVKEATKTLETGKVYTKMKFTTPTLDREASSIARETVHTKLPEGMLPEELNSTQIGKIMSERYHSMRYGKEYLCRGTDEISKRQFLKKLNEKSVSGIAIDDEVDWIYRKPSWMTDRIKSFKILPQERISMNLNADPNVIEALDRYISTGEVIVNGKIVKKVKPPKAYYKVAADDSFFTRSDPFTMYFREPINQSYLDDIKQITEPFKCKKDVYEDALFKNGQLADATWLSRSKEHSPEDLYKLYKRALRISPELAEGITKSGIYANRVPDFVCRDFEISDKINRYRFRISEGQYYSIEQFVNDFEKALGKTPFEKIG